MQVPDEVRKCVCFVYYRKEGRFRAAGTAFFSAHPVPGTAGGRGGTVTARHVIDGIMGSSDDGKVLLRLNRRGGGLAAIETEAADWLVHPEGPSADVAVYPWLPPLADLDHLVYTAEQAVTDDLLRQEQVTTGDEVFLAGLFVNHFGVDQNIPIVRVGNIAAMPGEPVNTQLGPMDAYLVEARSIGGLSGSPVFLNLGIHRQAAAGAGFTFGRVHVYLLGVMHGHWDTAIDVLGNEAVNMGIAIVIPISKVLELFESREEFREMEKAARRGANLPTPDVHERDQPVLPWGNP
jgi:hypothetical protein